MSRGSLVGLLLTIIFRCTSSCLQIVQWIMCLLYDVHLVYYFQASFYPMEYRFEGSTISTRTCEKIHCRDDKSTIPIGDVIICLIVWLPFVATSRGIFCSSGYLPVRSITFFSKYWYSMMSNTSFQLFYNNFQVSKLTSWRFCPEYVKNGLNMEKR